MDIKEATDRLLLVRKYGRERRIETGRSEIAILGKLTPEEQGEVMAAVQRAEAQNGLGVLSGGAR